MLSSCDSSSPGESAHLDASSSDESAHLFSRDSSVAYHEVQAKFPKGISEAEAMKIMNEIGAEVSLLESEGAINHMLVGTISDGDAEWMIGVSIMDDVVSGHSVNITSK